MFISARWGLLHFKTGISHNIPVNYTLQSSEINLAPSAAALWAEWEWRCATFVSVFLLFPAVPSFRARCIHRVRKYIAVGLHDVLVVRARPAATILRRESEWVRERAEDYSSRCFIHHSGKWCMVLTAIKVYICERELGHKQRLPARPAVGNMHVVPVAYISCRAAHHSCRGLAWLCAAE